PYAPGGHGHNPVPPGSGPHGSHGGGSHGGGSHGGGSHAAHAGPQGPGGLGPMMQPTQLGSGLGGGLGGGISNAIGGGLGGGMAMNQMPGTPIAQVSGVIAQPTPYVARSRIYAFVVDETGMPIELGSGRFAKCYLGEERWVESKTTLRRPVAIK